MFTFALSHFITFLVELHRRRHYRSRANGWKLPTDVTYWLMDA